MSGDDIHNNHNNEDSSEDIPPQPQSRAPVRYNWERGMSVSSMVGVVAIVGMGALLLFGVALCSRPPAGAPLPGAGGGILERNVKAAFGDNTPEDREGGAPSDRAPSSSSGASEGQTSESQPQGGQPPQSASRQRQSERESPQERQQRVMEEEQDAIKAQEELRDTQREQVPSILPENPPTPVPLGGNDY